MEKSWKDAIKRVLAESAAPLHYTEISDQILSQGYYATDGATPAATVNAQITASIKHDGDKSLFLRVGRGTFTLRQPSAPAEKPKAAAAKAKPLDGLDESEVEASDSIIQCFGMYWQRDLVVWRSDAKLFGRQ